MTKNTIIELKVTGQRGTEPLAPGNVGVSYLIDALTLTRELLNSEKGEDPVITIHEGSLALRHESLPEGISELTYMLERVARDAPIDTLPVKVRKALYGLRKLAARHGDTVTVSDQNKELLVINKDTEFIEDTKLWVDSEIYIRGTVTNAGRVSNPNLHVKTDDPRLGILLIAASEAQLSDDDQNRLYKPVSLRISIKEHAQTGNFDTKSARLLDFVETKTIKAQEVSGYVDQLINRAKNSWESITDKEVWLGEIRGHENN
jgi:hypothetical protein